MRISLRAERGNIGDRHALTVTLYDLRPLYEAVGRDDKRFGHYEVDF
jgi:hypothetical protein